MDECCINLGYVCPCCVPFCPCCNPKQTVVKTTRSETGQINNKPDPDVYIPADTGRSRPLIIEEEKNPFISPENRLERRDMLFCEDETISLAVKSGDVGRIKWLFDKGFPLNYNIMDTDGMCYEATELAMHHNQPEVAQMFRDLMVKGPPRQKVTIIYDGKKQDFVIPNSGEDEKLFRAEIKWFHKLNMRAEIDVYQHGDPEKKNLKWNKLREGRTYVAELC